MLHTKERNKGEKNMKQNKKSEREKEFFLEPQILRQF